MPSVVDNWLEVANERGTDASTLKSGARLVAAVYMAGYAVECKLKALLHQSGKPFPTKGQAGHDLRSLWEAAGFRLGDIQGYKRLFIDIWSTDLRYQGFLPEGTDFGSLYQGAIELSGYVQRRLRGNRRRRD